MTIGDIAERFEIGGVRFELVDFFKPNEMFIEGTVMLKRAKIVGAIINDETAQRLLLNRHRIPKELREFDVVLAGPVRRIDGRGIGRGMKFISYIHYRGGLWVEGLGGVRYDWSPKARLVRLCN
ncbi:hypothetical protein A3K33_01820 [Candidatus Azambacteria bacterium RIFOXYC1_FULL_41_20]|nr:MAG: hypothetical protein UU33_C0001G0325 [Candidatus Azambacteria bacterium GW2011_GWF1_41_10]KKS49359.1 MAG: hypothetical protein UV14_C0001G0105 [Candidatus Azambacteria bacterium GW2011_GWF2_42_22]KKT03470.1 MAG: hypothetical protein UV81_C0001G0066 [Candidatus Azambacteria bacterium GW2011_GWD1_43_18]KKT12498.1 MAG: hypothetical protein UV93_C0003G0060 [Candidatus Azambacteria bacterium GW2011_GWC2_43_27]OGD41263.1 MAG: hypothetical protein A3K28_01825 [Candidatus Azambacteria bacterium